MDGVRIFCRSFRYNIGHEFSDRFSLRRAWQRATACCRTCCSVGAFPVGYPVGECCGLPCNRSSFRFDDPIHDGRRCAIGAYSRIVRRVHDLLYILKGNTGACRIGTVGSVRNLCCGECVSWSGGCGIGFFLCPV